MAIERIIRRLEELEKRVKSLENMAGMDLAIEGGLDDGKRHVVRVDVLLAELLKELNIKPVFKREIKFIARS